MKNFKGSKYDAGLDVAEIARRLRVEYKAAQKSGQIPAGKVAVTIKRYSGGQSLRVAYTPAANVAASLVNPQYVTARAEGCCTVGIARLSEDGRRVQDVLASMRAAYNYDRSDSQSDYFDVNFYGDATVDVDDVITVIAAAQATMSAH